MKIIKILLSIFISLTVLIKGNSNKLLINYFKVGKN